MLLAVENIYLPPILLCLLVAAYMFAALKFPALRFIFRLKGFAARTVGMDEDDNRQLSHTLGLIFCPLIGIGALGAAGWLALEWKHSNARDARMKEERAARHQEVRGQIAKLLESGEIGEIYFETNPKRGVSEQGRKQVEDFVRELGRRFGPEFLPTPLEEARSRRDGLTVAFKPDKGPFPAQFVSMFPERDEISIWTHHAVGYKITIPAELGGTLNAFETLERIDLEALKREEQRKVREEEKRLSDYKERTFEGTPAWQIRDIVSAAPNDQQDAKRQEFLGMKFDWECRLITVEDSDGKLKVQATQSRPDPGSSWVIRFETERARLPGVERLPRFVFVRIRGTIASLEKGIGVRVDELERFNP